MYNFKETEEQILKFWKEKKIYEKSLEKTKNKKQYTFYDGPPFATGLPHYGHILGSIVKDVIPRFWTMKGFYVRRVWGWDCHGLPIENITEKAMGIKTKDEIEKIGVAKFNNFCRSQVLKYTEEWKKTIERIARWVDMDNAYKTMDSSYMESVWWAFKELYNKKLVYKGEKVLMYCPRCETPLAASEISMDQSYKTVTENTITVRFKLKSENVYALAWTTTPWTLPSNLALTVNRNLKYAYIQDLNDKNTYILAEDLIKNYYKTNKDYKILKIVDGNSLIGKKYEPLFNYFENLKNSFRIIPGDFVTAEDGTGIVHTAPAFGEDDYNASKDNGIDFVMPVDKQGKFTKEVTDFAGQSIFDSNEKIIEFLKEHGNSFRIERKDHEYPFCYRCETPLIYRAIPSWFINIQKIKPNLLKLYKKMNWHPDFLKEGRFRYNIENAPDWNVSRNRYWASAIPIWECKECGKIKVIGSIKELKKEAINAPKGKEVDLHKDFLDNVKLKCSCGEEMKRVPEVLDCWFESGSMPFAQFHYPFENKKEFEKSFPGDFVSEYIAQTRTWYYYCSVLAAALFSNIPYKNVSVTGTILAEDGSKMSKSKGNFPEPDLIMNKYGADSLRFYLLSSTLMNAEDANFSEKGVEEVYKKILVVLYNVCRFYELYKTDKLKINSQSKNIVDLWIISRLNELIKESTDYMNKYNMIKTCQGIEIFVNDLSTWYIRRSRDRFNNDDKDAKRTLGFVLDNLSKIIAPIIPYVSESIYQAVNGKNESVHLQHWPKSGKIDKKVLENMKVAREISSLALKERDVTKIALKQPLAKLLVSGVKLLKEYQEIVADELNVKKIELKEGKKIEVKLDTKITKELEEEGFAREISRKIQDARKKAGLVKKDKINLAIVTDLQLEKQKKFIKERTHADKILILKEIKDIEEKSYKNKDETKIKDEKIKILFTKL